jgi:hypothetical protein
MRGVEYEVSADLPTGILRCTCEASKYPKTRGRCWRIKAVASGAIARVQASTPTPATTHQTAIVEGFDFFGQPLYTPMCHTCRRAGQATLSRVEAEGLIAAHLAAEVRS